MDSSYKNMLIGAFATGAVDAGLEGYYAYASVPRGQFPYILVHPALPPVDDWIACVGTPLALYALGKVLKKAILTDMAKGGAIYGVSELLGQTLYRVALIAQGVTPLRYTIVR